MAGVQHVNTAILGDATSDDLTKLHGVIASKDELNKLDGAGAVVASGTQGAHIADISDSATGAEIATAVNGALARLEAFGMSATE